jgi:hypothetical protein
MPFKANPRFQQDVARSSEMRRYLDSVTGDAAREVESRLPYPNILGGLDVTHEMNMTGDGWEGEVRVDGPGWHLWEFGTSNNGARPAIRPGVQAALSPHGGRLGESR